MKIAFFTEIPINGYKFPRNHINMRTEFAWMVALDAVHYNIHYLEEENENIKGIPISHEYDLGIIIIPKKNPTFDLEKIRKHCKKIATMQEGPHWFFQDYPLNKQIWFYNILQQVDFLLVHNKLDKQYFQGLTQKDCIVMPSLMIEDSINNLEEIERSGIIIGGNFCNWYGGFDSYIVSQIFNEEIYIPTMGRKIEGEEQMPGLTHLPYTQWAGWIAELNKRKYGVHLMRTHAAGTFALNCAYLGIPCIGYKGLDTQELCHPDLTIEVGDIASANEKAKKLKDNEAFYQLCSETARVKYKQHFSEESFIKNFSSHIKL